QSGALPTELSVRRIVAERVGFEPTRSFRPSALAGHHLKPLGHLSRKGDPSTDRIMRRSRSAQETLSPTTWVCFSREVGSVDSHVKDLVKMWLLGPASNRRLPD